MRAEIIDPTTASVTGDWELFRKREHLIAAWRADALTAIAWCSVRPVRLGLVRDGGEPVALFVGELLSPWRRRAAYAAPGARPAVCWFDCRLLRGFTEGFAFAARLSAPERRAALREFERALRRAIGPGCRGALYRQVTDEWSATVGGRFRPRIPTAPNTLLENRWPDLDAYFADLPRERRRRLRRIRAEAQTGTRPLTGPIDPRQAALLAHQTVRKHGGGAAPPIPAEYFRMLGAAEGVRYFGHLDGDVLLSFDLAFDDGERLVTTVNGSLDVRDGGRRDLYFDLYLQEIAYMIENDLHGIEFGKGMADLKQRFGASLIPQTLAVAAW